MKTLQTFLCQIDFYSLIQILTFPGFVTLSDKIGAVVVIVTLHINNISIALVTGVINKSVIGSMTHQPS